MSSYDCSGHLRVRFYNMKTFNNRGRREGAELDSDSVKKVFSTLDPHRDFRELDSPTREELLQDLERTAQQDCSTTSALVIIVSSHGEEDRSGHVLVQCKDESVRVSELLAMFTAERCPGLANKPKLFIFECCRGDAEQTVVVPGGKEKLPPVNKCKCPTVWSSS